MIQAFKDGKDIYATIASLSFNLPYEKCLEFHPETGEYQPDGKARRGEAKSIVLGEQM
nr:MAG TPA: DNA polymerase I [Caudoviricetes sp.]